MLLAILYQTHCGSSDLSTPASSTYLWLHRKMPFSPRSKAVNPKRSGHQSQMLEPGDTEAQPYQSLQNI